MTLDDTIRRISDRICDGGPVNLQDAENLLRRIGQLEASNELATEHMERGRQHRAALELELDTLKSMIRDLNQTAFPLLA